MVPNHQKMRLQQAIHIVNDLFACRRETTNSMQGGGEGIEVILLHVVEEIHIRFPNMYIGLRMLAGKPLKVFFKEVYEEYASKTEQIIFAQSGQAGSIEGMQEARLSLTSSTIQELHLIEYLARIELAM